MNLDLTAYEKAFAALPDNVTAAEVCADGHEELLIRVSGGKQTGSENFSKTTLYLPFFLLLCFFCYTLLCFLLLHNKSP